ncbi:hypothetical protein [Variovorax sp. YR216]|uniref:hypothetical protein n=1 Tax=Variovorax sp. YR216 TaxID=1882828 RepID=UPI00210D79F5|nr:hypothetical protein [Variovorax sp. YR216]
MADLLDDIAARLTQDYQFKLKAGGKYLQEGVCPQCGDQSMWTYAASPWVVRCQRNNNCGYEAHAKELYPDLFESWTDRFQKPEEVKPAEQRNPNAAADAYLRLGRGFDLALIQGLYTQETYADPRADQGRGASSSTVRFQVGVTWWERIIDRPQRFGKKKAHFKAGAMQGTGGRCLHCRSRRQRRPRRNRCCPTRCRRPCAPRAPTTRGCLRSNRHRPSSGWWRASSTQSRWRTTALRPSRC